MDRADPRQSETAANDRADKSRSPKLPFVEQKFPHHSVKLSVVQMVALVFGC
jgi:hypothetical protein